MLLLVTQDGQRLDAFLASQNIVLSREKAKKLIAAGNVCVNTVIVKKMAYILSADDAVTVKAESNDQQNIAVEPIDQSLPVLFEDDACLVVNKPAGLAVHPGAGMEPGEKTLLNGIAFLFMGRGIPFSEEAVLVHRLDKETTGCLLVAKNAAAHKTLQKQFESRTVEKLYLALVAGIPSPASAVIDAPIGRSSMNRTRMSITGVGSVRHAKTTYRTLVTNMVHSTALVECDLHTGRTHQIRVHLHAIGHPILGDPSYFTAQSQKIAAKLDIHNVCLHSRQIQFNSPADGKTYTVTAPIAADFMKVLKNIGMDESV